MTGCDLDTAVADWVIEHPETLKVFQDLGVEYSCGGRSLDFACRERGLDGSSVLAALREVIGEAGSSDAPEQQCDAQEEAMAIPHAAPATVIDVGPLAAHSGEDKTRTLVKTDGLEIIRLVLPAGKEIGTHLAPGQLTVQCLDGRVAFTAMGKTLTVEPGQMFYLHAREPHSVRAEADSVLLLTIVLPEGD